MKYLVLLFLTTFVLFSCENKDANTENQATEVPTDNSGSQDDPELVAVTEVIHNFYAWYENNSESLSKFEIVNSGKPATINKSQLDMYYKGLAASGFFSQTYFDTDLNELKKLEATDWKNQNAAEEPLSGLDYDRLVCAQDYDFERWKTAAIAAEGLDTEKVTATLLDEESTGHQSFELVKENGKWLISAVICQ